MIFAILTQKGRLIDRAGEGRREEEGGASGNSIWSDSGVTVLEPHLVQGKCNG